MTFQVTIAKVWNETSEIKCFDLRPLNGHALPPVEPGSHIDVHVGEKLVRQYSLWNGPDDKGRYFIGVKRELESRGGSAGMHRLSEGDTITISDPKNNFPLSETEGESILIAGGIGITPLLSMARHLAAWKRPHHLHLFTRSVDHTPFKEILDDAVRATIHTGLSGEDRDATIADLLSGGGAGNMHVYTCGPQPFMNLVMTTAEAKGWPSDQVHFEYFTVEPVADAAGDVAFEVYAAQSDKAVVVAPGQSITDALLAEGIEIMTSCEQGVCGTCLSNVLEGEPDHRDVYLNPAEKTSGKVIMPCVSRCKGKRLVLDI